MAVISIVDNEDSTVVNTHGTKSGLSTLAKLKGWHWWVLVIFNIFFLIIGQVVAVLLGRFYYDQGGNSKWLATLIQTIGFPILLIPLVIFPSSKDSSITSTSSFSLPVIFLMYIVIGALIAGDNMLYSVGLLYLSASTYSLICATQLAFSAILSFFLNSQKFTTWISISVVALSISASLLAVNEDSDKPSGVTKGKYILGFVATLTASALYALLLSLMQLSFQKVLKKDTFSVALELQIYTSFVATCISTVGLFASGEWRTLGGEMSVFGKGSLAYVMTLVWTAVAWQVCSVGVVGLVFVVSSLFSNVISNLSLAMTPLAALAVFHDKMSWLKIVAMCLGLCGFSTYLYQNYLDDLQHKNKQTDATGEVLSEASTPLLLE